LQITLMCEHTQKDLDFLIKSMKQYHLNQKWANLFSIKGTLNFAKYFLLNFFLKYEVFKSK
jgi:hypothetical protein